MPDTALGVTYPDATAHTRLWEHFQTLAADVDALVTARSWGIEGRLVSLSASSAAVSAATDLITSPAWSVKAGRRYRLTHSAYGTVYTATGDSFQLQEVVTPSGGAAGSFQTTGTKYEVPARVGNNAGFYYGGVWVCTATGTVVAKATITRLTGTGTGQVLASASNPHALVMEDIGPA